MSLLTSNIIESEELSCLSHAMKRKLFRLLGKNQRYALEYINAVIEDRDTSKIEMKWKKNSENLGDFFVKARIIVRGQPIQQLFIDNMNFQKQQVDNYFAPNYPAGILNWDLSREILIKISQALSQQRLMHR